MSDVSESLISFTKIEQMSESLIFLSDSLGNQMSEFPALVETVTHDRVTKICCVLRGDFFWCTGA